MSTDQRLPKTTDDDEEVSHTTPPDDGNNSIPIEQRFESLQLMFQALQQENLTLRDQSTRLREVTNACQDLEMEVNHWMEAHDAESERCAELMAYVEELEWQLQSFREGGVGGGTNPMMECLDDDDTKSQLQPNNRKPSQASSSTSLMKRKRLVDAVAMCVSIQKRAEESMLMKHFERWRCIAWMKKRISER